ncbi:MAG: GAF domain-containing sensor histidine kinase [Anaerolineae bacterium]|nr:GAF domain-containing sensor histidine kinase [Anaerolineae bacterium]
MSEISSDAERLLRKRLERLEHVISISQILNTTLDLAELLRVITTTAAEVTDCEGSSILLIDPQSGQLRFEAAYGPKSEALKPITVPLEGSLAGWVVQHRQPLLIPDVRRDPRHYRQVDTAVEFTTRSLLAVPLVIRDHCIGALEVVNKREPPPLDEEDTYVLSALASQAAVAIENARLLGDLQRAHAELTQLDRLKSDFIAVASHELRTPLALILGYAAFLKDTLTGPNREQVDIVYESAMRLRELIDDMLNLRYIQTGAAELRPEETNLPKLVRDVLQEFRPLAEGKRQRLLLEVAPSEEGYLLRLDPSKVRLVLTNLLSNAVKFTPEGGTISVLVSRTLREARVCVADTGEGIPPEALSRVFDQFYQAEPVSTRRHEGLGLGLSIAKGLVELHGGRIWAESEPGKGAAFTFTLPAEPIPPEHL